MKLIEWPPLLNDTQCMGLIVLALLIVATIIIKVLNSQGNFNELWLRIKSWWLMSAFFFFSLIVHPTAAIILFAFLSFLALKEYFTLIETRKEDHRLLFWSYLAIPIQYWWIYIDWRPMFFIFVPVYMFLFIPLRLLFIGNPKGMVGAVAKIQWGLMAFVFCISHLAFLMTLPSNAEIPGGGKSLLLFVVVLTELNDVFQYIWGKLFGKRKITPTISPNKTWEGFIGGIISTIGLAFAFQFLTDFKPIFSLAAGLIISLAGFIGDLVISAIKRDIGVKDSGNLIPGHGGVLDRIDSLTYSAPLFFHFVAYFFY